MDHEFFLEDRQVYSFYGIRKRLLALEDKDMYCRNIESKFDKDFQFFFIKRGNVTYVKIRTLKGHIKYKDTVPLLQVTLTPEFTNKEELRYHIYALNGSCAIYGKCEKVDGKWSGERIHFHGPNLTGLPKHRRSPDDPELIKLINLFASYGVKGWLRGNNIQYQDDIDVTSDYTEYPTD